MNVQQTLYAMGFRRESMGGNLEAMVWRDATHTWVATTIDGGYLPDDDSWLVCEYTNESWDEGGDDLRSYSSETHYIADVIADMGGFAA